VVLLSISQQTLVDDHYPAISSGRQQGAQAQVSAVDRQTLVVTQTGRGGSVVEDAVVLVAVKDVVGESVVNVEDENSRTKP
jgi:hypothetical protein